jgi:hypothetical protein
MNIQSVGRVGVAHIQMVGGPHDGEHHWAVLGAPVTLLVPPPPPAAQGVAAYSLFASWMAGPVPGDEWRDGKKPKPSTPMDAFAVYLPETRDGKAAPFARYEGMFRVPTTRTAPPPTEDNDDA